jgi:hypothetical protein
MLDGDTIFRYKARVASWSTLGNCLLYVQAHILTNGGFTIPFKYSSDSINIVLKIPDNEIISGLNVYPNPANTEIILTSDKLLIDKVKIKNISGSILKEINNVSKNQTIETADLSDGIYILECQSTSGNFYSKLIIHH